jgi:hypothetical protein
MYVEVTATVQTHGANWTGIESEPTQWSWPTEFLTSALSNPTSGSPINYVEWDNYDYSSGTNPQPNFAIYTETQNGDGNLYWVGNPGPGATAQYGWAPTQNLGTGSTNEYGILIMTPTSGAGGSPNVGEIVLDNNGTSITPVNTLTYGPSVAPVTQPGGGTPGGVNGTYVPIPTQHNCIMLDAAPDWPQTIGGTGLIGIAVWTAPPAPTGTVIPVPVFGQRSRHPIIEVPRRPMLLSDWWRQGHGFIPAPGP